MPVTVQLPGYNHAAPGVALAELVNSGLGAYKNYKQGQLANTETQAADFKNQASQRELDYQKKLIDPATPESRGALQDLVANVQMRKELGQKIGLSKDAISPLNDILDAAKNGIPTGKLEALPDGQVGPQQQMRQPMSGMDAVRAKDSPFLKSIDSLFESKQKADAMASAAGIRNAGQNDRNQGTTNRDYGHDIGPMDSTIVAANRVNGIIKRIQSGELKSTPTLTTDLSNALGSMFNNGKAATVSGSEHAVAGMTSAEGDFNSKYGYAFGKPMNSVAPEQLSQLAADVNALRSEYVDARKNAYESWREGVPEKFRPAMDARFNKLSGTSAAPTREGQPSKEDVAAELKRRGLLK